MRKILDYLVKDGLYNDRNNAEIAFTPFNNQDQQDPKKQKIDNQPKLTYQRQ